MQMLGLVSNVCVTHTTATTTKLLIKKTTTPQSSNAKSTNIRGLWCPCSDNEDTATVITMQMHATRIALLLAGKNGALLILGGALRILDNKGEKEE